MDQKIVDGFIDRKIESLSLSGVSIDLIIDRLNGNAKKYSKEILIEKSPIRIDYLKFYIISANKKTPELKKANNMAYDIGFMSPQKVVRLFKLREKLIHKVSIYD